MSNEIQIRPATISDAEQIAQFNIAMAHETEGKQLHEHIVLSGVEHLLGDSNKGFYLVAAASDRIVGCLMVTYEWSDWRDSVFWWIQSVYVKPEFRRRGLFRQLFEHVRNMSNQRSNVCGMRLYVEQDNTIAQRAYESLGMREMPYRIFETDFE